MNKSLLIYWKDKSGTSHRFWIHPRGTKFNEPCPGIYIYARETSPHKWIPIYIGQTENVNVRLTNHEQQECVDQNGATHIHVSIITSEKSRLATEKDLIEQWKPVCNTQFGMIAEQVAEANPDVVVRDEKGEVYTVRYEAANATLLSEFLKEHRKVQEQDATQMPTAPVNKPPATAVAKPQTSGMMQISVQLTFSFEIAAMQLTPTFKMGVLQVRPISKIVTMRVAPSQQPQPEVSFEIAKIQPVGETLGTIRVIPSQQQRPIMGSRSIAGLQLVPSVEATPIQVTPSQQGQAAVFVTVPCQISTIEFSPLFEIASVVLDSSSKQVLVQLAGAGPSPADGQRVFEIADLQLSEGGDAGMIQLNLLDQSPTET
jgi:hypothetical protein